MAFTVLAALVVYLLVTILKMVVGSELALCHRVLTLRVHVLPVSVLWDRALVRSWILGGLRCTPWHRLLLVVIYAKPTVVEAALQWHRAL